MRPNGQILHLQNKSNNGTGQVITLLPQSQAIGASMTRTWNPHDQYNKLARSIKLVDQIAYHIKGSNQIVHIKFHFKCIISNVSYQMYQIKCIISNVSNGKGSKVQRIIAMEFIEKVQLMRVQIASGSDIKGSNDKGSIAMAQGILNKGKRQL